MAQNLNYLILAFVVMQIPIGFYLVGFIRRYKKLTDEVALLSISIFAIDGIFALTSGLLSLLNSPSARLG